MTPKRILFAILCIAAGTCAGLVYQSFVNAARGCVMGGSSLGLHPYVPMLTVIGLFAIGVFIGFGTSGSSKLRRFDYPIFIAFCAAASFWLGCIYQYSVFLGDCIIVRYGAGEYNPPLFLLLVIFVLIAPGYLFGILSHTTE